MTVQTILTAEMLLVGAVGLVVGSFLGMVAHRLPIMLERAWAEYCATAVRDGVLEPGSDAATTGFPAASDDTVAVYPATAGRTTTKDGSARERYDLFRPPSHCPACGHRLGVLENIPLISWVLQRGRCRACDTFIGWREPLIELAAAVLAVVVCWRFGADGDRAFAAVFVWMLLLASVIDIQRGWLPDEVTGPLLWIGLVANLGGRFVTPEDAVIGAVAGYASLWLVYWGFRLATGREGMGTGDLHLLAAIGAWTGWQPLPGVILLAAALGLAWAAVAGMVLGRSRADPMPFGPMLSVAGLAALIWPATMTAPLTGGLTVWP